MRKNGKDYMNPVIFFNNNEIKYISNIIIDLKNSGSLNKKNKIEENINNYHTTSFTISIPIKDISLTDNYKYQSEMIILLENSTTNEIKELLEEFNYKNIEKVVYMNDMQLERFLKIRNIIWQK